MTPFLARFCRLAVLVLVLGSGLIPAQPAAASEATDPNTGISVVFWSETVHIGAGQVQVLRIKLVNTKPGSRSVGVVLTRDEMATDYFVNPSPLPSSGGGTSARIVWGISSLAVGQTWEARVGVQVKSALPPSYEKLFYVLQLGGTPIDGLRLATPLSQTPANATTAANPSVQSTLDPINAATGEYYAGPTTDLALGGPLPLAFSRYYAARLADEGMVQSALGANWMHNFDLRLPLRTDDQVKVAYQGGKIIYFVKTMGCCGWSLNFEQEPVRYQFTRGSASGAGDYWLLDPVSQRVYRFDDATGLLQAIHDRNGNRLDVTRDAGGKITQVCDWLAGPGARRALTFTYTGAQQRINARQGIR